MLHLPRGAVWLASYPKSGNTWMRILISNLASDKLDPCNINDLEMSVGSVGCRSFEHYTLLEPHLLRAPEIEALRPAGLEAPATDWDSAHFVKVHDAWGYLADATPQLGRSGRAALYLGRDPRDVAVSYAHHSISEIDSTIRWMNKPNAVTRDVELQIPQHFNDWSGHVRSWLDQRDVPVHTIRYEDLHADTGAVLKAALVYLGASFDNEDAARAAVDRAVSNSSFEELQRQEREKGFRERPSSVAEPAASKFSWQGQVGGWRDHLNAEQVKRIEDTHGETMLRLGYGLETA